MPGLYSATNRISGELITASKYMADHQNHIDNQTPQMTDDYSATAGQASIQTDPGAPGAESLATSLAGELERLRFAIAAAKGKPFWNDTPDVTDSGLLIWGII
jgi:hypothetical protein